MGRNGENLDIGQELEKIKIIETEKEKKVLVMGKLFMSCQKTDEVAPKVAIVQLYQQGIAKQEELAEVFQVHIKSVYNYITGYNESGIKGLIEQVKGPKESWKITPKVRGMVLYTVLVEKTKEYRKIQGILERRCKSKVSVESIRQVLRENGFLEEKIMTGLDKGPGIFEYREEKQMELDFGNENTEIKQESEKKDGEENILYKEYYKAEAEDEPVRRSRLSEYSRAERQYLDNLVRGEYNAYAGGLLFNGLLEKYNYLPIIKSVIKTGIEGDYGLEDLSLTLFHYDIFGFNSIRNYSYGYLDEFGVLLGRSSGPSRFTLQKFMNGIRDERKGEELMAEFGKEYIKKGIVKWGEVYIDGHFQPYYGLVEIMMGWHGVMQKPMKGNYNFMSVDGSYNPWLFLVRPADEDLLEMIPEIIMLAKKIGKETGVPDKEIEELTVIFDREGYSAKLFRRLSGKEKEMDLSECTVKFISWAKNTEKWLKEIKEEEFIKEVEIEYKIQKSEKVRYFDTRREMNKYGEIRAIVIQSGSKKKRAVIYTNDENRAAREIICLICRRWGEENLLKALKIGHYLDYYPGKGLYEADEKTEPALIDNPEVTEMKKEKSVLVTMLNELKVKLADAVIKMPEEKTKWEEIKKLKLELISDIMGLESQITILKNKISGLPKEVKYEDAHDGQKLFELDYEKKRFIDSIKVFVYTIQKQMLLYLSRYYKNPKDINSVLEMIVHRGGYIRLEDEKITVRFKKFLNQGVDSAARELCQDINLLNPKTLDKYCFPIHFEVE